MDHPSVPTLAAGAAVVVPGTLVALRAQAVGGEYP
jgi:hypothetical protein